MMPSFAIQTPDDQRVKTWMKKVSSKLETSDYFKKPLTGSIRYYPHGIYVVSIKPVYPQLIPNIGALSMAAGSAILYMVSFTVLSKIVLGFAIGIGLVWNMWWSPVIYQVIISLQLSRLLKKAHWAKRIDAELLRRMAYGEV